MKKDDEELTTESKPRWFWKYGMFLTYDDPVADRERTKKSLDSMAKVGSGIEKSLNWLGGWLWCVLLVLGCIYLLIEAFGKIGAAVLLGAAIVAFAIRQGAKN